MASRRLISLGCVGLALAAILAWAFVHTASPSPPVIAALLLIVLGLAVGPWVALVARQLPGEPAAGRIFWRVVGLVGLILGGGITAALLAGGESEIGAAVAALSVLAAALLALVGAVLLPWLFLLARTVNRERAARARAEERADVAAHLHDSVLQSLTLIQKQAEMPAVLRLARSAERELRAWLYGAPATSDADFAAAVSAVVADVEDRFPVTVELVTVGTCPLHVRTQAVIGAIREALTNAAKHGEVRRVSLFAEVADASVLVLVRDRGRGFDPAAGSSPDRRGIPDSIEARMRQHGGTAAIRSTVGEGTEVELRMPLTGGA
jgi:signal transduction histidine kinase